MGIEPSANVAEEASKYGINTLCSFFNLKTAENIVSKYGRADALIAANVMCHIPDLHDVAKGVDCLLKPMGVLVFEEPYLGDMIENTAYDQIYDEHVYMFSTHSVQNIFKNRPDGGFCDIGGDYYLAGTRRRLHKHLTENPLMCFTFNVLKLF